MIKSNYQIQVAAAASSRRARELQRAGRRDMGGTGYRAGADSIDPTLSRFYSTNASGIIYEADVALFAATPEAAPPPFGTAIH